MAGARLAGERGSGLVATWLGLLVFLSILLFAVQVLLNLYTHSVVGAAVYDAARLAATGGSQQEAEAHARRLLGRFGDEVRFDWTGSGTEQVVLRAMARAPGVLPAAIRGPVAFGRIDRAVHVRVERFR